MPQWTSEQLRAIETRGQNILLSAAAGSGKTTVLVARVLKLIESGETSIDRMLIVTFTRAASSDMRTKLFEALGRRADEGSELCREQQLLIERASISTLHGFCADFLRSHFEAAGIDPAFRVLDDAEIRRLRDEALDEALEEMYLAAEPAALALDYGRGATKLREMAEKLLFTLDERPDPEAWLQRACSPDEEMRLSWQRELVNAAKRDLERAQLLLLLALEHPGCNENYAPALEKDAEVLMRMREIEDYDELSHALASFKPTRAGAKRGVEPISEDVKRMRNEVKSILDRAVLRDLPLAQSLADASALEEQLAALGKLVLRARELFAQRKNELSGLSYTDLEHCTLRALQDEAVAREMQGQYDAIFVDEYQDTSDVQEAIVTRIARGDNLFMVGDVKQSIYRFRQAEPRLFLEKYERYGRGEGGMLLPLTRNFRSRPGILSFVNRIFERSMVGGDSEIVYDELAKLNLGRTDLDGGEVEMQLLETQTAEMDEAIKELKGCEREAMFIASRIHALKAENPELRYRDFAVLTRAKQGVLGPMATVLMQQGIPAFADGTDAFYDSVEIQLALSLLKLTANLRSDIELIGVLRSPVVGLDMDALASIRISGMKLPFIDAASARAQGDDRLAQQLRAFFDKLEKWRMDAMCTDLGVLTREIIEESGLYDCMGALPGGAQRRANLNRLIANAAAYDQNISGALTRFLRHTELLRARGDGDDAHVLGENDDVVRLMTVHKSKGLEFPVVFGAMLARKYSERMSSAALSAQRELGLGCAYCDPVLKTRRRTLPQQAIIERERTQDRAEELRILYVLLTRAKDRLVLVGSVSNLESAFARWRALRAVPGAASSYLDVLMPALLELDIEGYNFSSHKLQGEAAIEDETQQVPSVPESPSIEIKKEEMDALDWAYSEAAAAQQPLKLTVTGLLRELQAPAAQEKLIPRPSFLIENTGKMSATERGTAWHRAMQLLEMDTLRGLSGRELVRSIGEQLEMHVSAARMTKEQKDVIYLRAIADFLESDLGQRLLRAQEIRREWSFNAMMRIAEALSPHEAGGFADEEIMVQGTIDCCFIEQGCWVLVDYKTDRADDAEALTERYSKQLRLYALALERITGVCVKEIELVLLRAGETIEIPI